MRLPDTITETLNDTVNTTKAFLHTANDKVGNPTKKAVSAATKQATAKLAATIEPATERLGSLPGAERFSHLPEPRTVLTQWASHAEKLVADGTRRGKAVVSAISPALARTANDSEPSGALGTGDATATDTEAGDSVATDSAPGAAGPTDTEPEA